MLQPLLIDHAYAWSAGANDLADHRCAGGAVLFQNTFHFLQSFQRNTKQQAATRLCVCKQKAHRLRSAVHSTMAFAVSRFCLVPPGTQSCAMSEKTWRLITGTFAGTISAPTPLARHIEERCPSSPNPVTSTAARIKPSSASSAPTMFSWHMSVMDFLISAALVSPRLIPVVAIPVPRGFVKEGDRRRQRASSSACASGTPFR